jgi:hypothetical protein
MNNTPYTPEQLEGKYIVCSPLMAVKIPALTCVENARGPYIGMPFLYDSISSAQSDRYFDDRFDVIIPAIEYFQRVKDNNFKFDNLKKA